MIVSINKIVDIKKKNPKKTLAVSGGVFDIVHDGHIEYLKKIYKVNQILVMCVPSDEFIRSRKGPERPIQNAKVRAKVLDNMKQVDFTLLVNPKSKHAYPLVETVLKIAPNIFYVGEDSYEKIKVYKKDFNEKKIKLVVVKIKKINNSTDIINKIKGFVNK